MREILIIGTLMFLFVIAPIAQHKHNRQLREKQRAIAQEIFEERNLAGNNH